MNSDIPANIDCRIANPDLWSFFKIEFRKVNKMLPTSVWTEEEVTQWLDFNAPEQENTESENGIRAV